MRNAAVIDSFAGDFLGGTDGSNPVPSSGESTNFRFLVGLGANGAAFAMNCLVEAERRAPHVRGVEWSIPMARAQGGDKAAHAPKHAASSSAANRN